MGPNIILPHLPCWSMSNSAVVLGEGCKSVAEVPGDAWRETVADMRHLGRKLRRDGWETLATPAPQNTVTTTAEGEQIRVVHKLPREQGQEMVETLQAEGFAPPGIYTRDLEGWLFEVVVLLNPGLERAILLATMFDEDQHRALRDGQQDVERAYSLLDS